MGSAVELILDARRRAHFLQVLQPSELLLQPSVLQNWDVLPESTAVWPGQCTHSHSWPLRAEDLMPNGAIEQAACPVAKPPSLGLL